MCSLVSGGRYHLASDTPYLWDSSNLTDSTHDPSNLFTRIWRQCVPWSRHQSTIQSHGRLACVRLANYSPSDWPEMAVNTCTTPAISPPVSSLHRTLLTVGDCTASTSSSHPVQHPSETSFRSGLVLHPARLFPPATNKACNPSESVVLRPARHIIAFNRSFRRRRRVFPGNHLPWYWQHETNKRKYTQKNKLA